MPAFPSIDVTCDRKLRTIPLTRSQASEDAAVATYEVPHDISGWILKAGECRLFVPGVVVGLPRQHLWKAWAGPAKGTRAPKVISAQVLDVIDGDTIRVALGKAVEKVRYIGIDTPETNHPTRGLEPGGREATEVNRLLLARREIRLELDVQERDRYGRLLAYVYVGDQMVNAELVRRGFAQVMTVPPNVRHQDLFVKLQREAREGKRGLWAEPTEAPTPPPVAQADTTASGGRPGVPPSSAWACPVTHPVKGNFTTYSGERCIHHVMGGRFYDKTKPERCYATDDDARRDGCRRSKR
jgi:micrococcal nuclease